MFVNIAINKKEMEAKTVYLSIYDELFINGQREVGNGITVEIFDRNRLYIALGCFIRNGLRVQLGALNQTTDNWGKNQLQLSLHQRF